MTSKSGFFVLILIASGCLSKACGEGQLEGATTPTSMDEANPDQPDVNRPETGAQVAPYAHVTPADIGVTIGPGVIAAYPTDPYTGPCDITQDGTTIENKVVTCEILNVDADNVTFRNSVINLTRTGTSNGFRLGNEGDRSGAVNFLIEYSLVSFPNPEGKLFAVWGADHSNFTIRNSHLTGGFDFFDIAGNLDGMLIENNVLGPLGCKTDVFQHSDGFQIGGKTGAYGTFTIRGNWVEHQSQCGKTAFYFFDNDLEGALAANAIIESNRLDVWGGRTLWASEHDSMQVRYNVYSNEWRSGIGNRCSGTENGCGTANPKPCCYYPSEAAVFNPTGGPSSSFVCNRYENGDFVEEQWVGCQGGGDCGVAYVTTGCPSYP